MPTLIQSSDPVNLEQGEALINQLMTSLHEAEQAVTCGEMSVGMAMKGWREASVEIEVSGVGALLAAWVPDAEEVIVDGEQYKRLEPSRDVYFDVRPGSSGGLPPAVPPDGGSETAHQPVIAL